MDVEHTIFKKTNFIRNLKTHYVLTTKTYPEECHAEKQDLSQSKEQYCIPKELRYILTLLQSHNQTSDPRDHFSNTYVEITKTL